MLAATSGLPRRSASGQPAAVFEPDRFEFEGKMSEITKRWLSDECRLEDGIYFPDDTFIPLGGHVPQLPRRPIDELLRTEPDAWESIYRGDPLAALPDHVVFGGETSWEGAGFLALVRASDRSLVWLLHSACSEPFRSASVQGSVLFATSGEGLSSSRWNIPLQSPWSLSHAAGEE